MHIRDELVSLELHLLRPRVRASVKELDRLLTDDFFEIGASGRRVGKAEILAGLPLAPPTLFTAVSFEYRELAPSVAQLVYKVTWRSPARNKMLYSLCTSVWRQNPVGWQMSFHQGTYCEPFRCINSPQLTVPQGRKLEYSHSEP